MTLKLDPVCLAPSEGYKSPEDEDGAEDVVLEGEQGQAHVGEDEVLGQEVKHLKELQEEREKTSTPETENRDWTRLFKDKQAEL